MNRTTRCAESICWTLAVSCLLMLAGCGGGGDHADSAPASQNDSQQLRTEAALSRAVEQMQLGRHEPAMKLVQDVLITAPDQVDALSIAIEIHVIRDELCEAAALAERVAELQPDNASFILTKAFDWRLRCGDHLAAEENLRRAIAGRPDGVELHRTMAGLLGAQGRRYEASVHLKRLLKLGASTPEELLGLIDLSGPFSLVSYDEVVDPTEVTLFTMHSARKRFFDQLDADAALDLLEPVAKRYPKVAAVAALKGRILAEAGDLEGLTEWADSLPSGIDGHPEYWSTLGSWLSQTDRHEEAVRAFGEALRRDPTDRQSLRLMIASLESLNQIKKALALRPKLATLDDIFRNALNADASQCEVIADQLQDLTRHWEAAGWARLAAAKAGTLRQKAGDLTRRRRQILAWESTGTARQISDARLQGLLGFELQAWPLPSIDAVRIAAAPRQATVENTTMRMEDVASQVGIETTYVSGLPPDGEAYFLYQINGGGLAALDYDLDGRTDLYVTQAGGKPPEEISTPNQLYRQLPNQTFTETGEISAVDDRGFGQGVCAGDLNQDGFPDLVIANIGSNAIYLNQGDGTFREATGLLPDRPLDWTSSVAVADLDGDHLPEIVAANYIDDPTIYRHTCLGGWLSGGRMDCVPQQHQAANDRIYRSLGDGSFASWKSAEDLGKLPNFGFGIAIANIDDKNGNDIFITNDGDLNHFWSSQPAATGEGGPYQMVESAGVLGCSIGANGLSQACMGLACGDFDQNGHLDFHVTNFYNESSNLYLQNESGFFMDAAMKYRLKPATYKVVGFGTQASDFDNDGWEDLAVVNGHVHDDSSIGIAYRMEPQMLRGEPGGFVLQSPEQLGSFWSLPQLGRTVATLDWNRDGRIDLVANSLDQPIALLDNRSEGGQWLQLELIGTQSERDAIGAKVRVTAGDRTWTRWQMGGDGYMCTNEPVIHVGLDQAAQVGKVEIEWPSGQTQAFGPLEANHRYLVIEGEPTCERRRDDPAAG